MNTKSYKIEIGDIKLHVETVASRITPLNTVISENKKYLNTHMHPTFELFLVLDGSITVTTHKNKFECRNSIVIIPPSYPHFTTMENARILVIDFKIKESPTATGVKLFERTSKALSSDITVLPFSDDGLFYANKFNELQYNSFMASERQGHLLYLLFSEILSTISTVSRPSVEKHNNYVKQIEAYLSTHYHEKILISDIGKMLYISPKQVARIIKKEFKLTFPKMLISYRLGIACMLLSRSEIEINKIASAVGYEYSENFYLHFKKAYGVTPKEYRESFRKSDV